MLCGYAINVTVVLMRSRVAEDWPFFLANTTAENKRSDTNTVSERGNCDSTLPSPLSFAFFAVRECIAETLFLFELHH